MKTSYFSKYKELLQNGYDNLVSISGKSLPQFSNECLHNPKLREYKKLAPTYYLWKEWHDNNQFLNQKLEYYQGKIKQSNTNDDLFSNHFQVVVKNDFNQYLKNCFLALKQNDEEYARNYQKIVLDKLDPLTIYNQLGENAILLCWQSSEKFCHRHLVAKWLQKNLNIEIKEY